MSTITRTLKKAIKPVHLSRLNFFTSAFRLEGSERLQSKPEIDKRKAFSEEEELLIVKTINSCSETDFERYDIKKAQLKKLIDYKERNGKFETFSDVLVTQDVPSLIKLCKSILSGRKPKITIKTKPVRATTVPAVDSATKESIKSVVGLHIWSNTISWALLQKNNLTQWEQRNIENPSKSNLVSLINTVSSITERIPDADAYVMEADPYTSMSKLKSAAYVFYVQRQQVISTIISILGMRRRLSNNYNSSSTEDQKINNFFMMASRSSAKRFNLTVGNEIMPPESIIKNVLEGNLHHKISHFPKIAVDADVISNYKSSHGIDRDQLHSALLIALAFVDVVHQDDTVAK
ncbi:uncharacterized protein LOC123274462 isoform X1 [Cotesia glomerata]|uniref:Transcription elongation factor, mitochondrial n=1 Tax=Cotesia glomerata TaxID=32391 RepID=A0AAV7ISW3_COTGL|nr:uncharacterized protein LOC123274462 isoform X1 [Cotesia glomerata]KAH0556637.1 hypothetical protein KQX54_001031 [Cotesia glomerata]